jgi:hypothetical protein
VRISTLLQVAPHWGQAGVAAFDELFEQQFDKGFDHCRGDRLVALYVTGCYG